MAASDRERTQRRVYVLPSDLVDRISEFQREMGLPSEVEAARRLLDEALKHRDGAMDIARRFRERLSDTKIFSDIAREVLVGHPRVTSINFQPSSISFRTTDGVDVVIHQDGSGSVGDPSDFESEPLPSFKKEAKTKPDFDDDIPF